MVIGKIVSCLILFLALYFKSYGQIEVIENPEWGKWQEREKAPISFELIQTFGTDFPDESAVFSSGNGIWSVATDSIGNVYVLDIDVEMLVKFSSEGEVLWKIDQRGNGPGDLNNPQSLAVADSIYITNLRGTRLDIFSKEGEYVESINLDRISKQSISIIGVINNRHLILKTEILGKIGIQISVLDIHDEFKLISQYEATEETEFEIPENELLIPKTTIIDDLVVVSKSFTYGFSYYRMNGTLVKEINREFPRYMRPGFSNSGNIPTMVALSKVYPPYKVEDEYLINFIHWPTKIDDPDEAVKKMSKMKFPELGTHNSLDIFSLEGKLLYSIESIGIIPEIGWLKHTDQKGNLYTVTGMPFPQVRKYKVSINK